jgi:type IV pilus assembly protein PilX
MKSIARSSHRSRQRGAVLFVSLILLLILTIIGVTAARMQTGEAVMARNDHNHQLAVQSAEAVLRDVEANLINANYTPAQLTQNLNGFYTLAMEVAPPGPGASFADTMPNANAMAYTGPALTGTALAPLAASPTAAQVIVEQLPAVTGRGGALNGLPYGTNSSNLGYRVTAYAGGGDSSASATLQSVLY